MLLAEPPCQQVCESLALQCASDPILWSLLPPSVTNCDAVDPSTGLKQFPESSISVQLGGSSVSIGCNTKAINVTRAYQAISKGTCEPFESPTIYSQCSQAVSWKRVFVPEGATQRQLDFEALNSTFQLMYREVDQQCSAAALEFICGGIFLGCESMRYDVIGTDCASLSLSLSLSVSLSLTLSSSESQTNETTD